MATPTLLVKDQKQIMTDMTRTIKSGLIDLGVADPQVGPGTDYNVVCQAITNELLVAMQNIVLQSDALMPDTAIGTDLDRILVNSGMSRRAASTSNGFIRLITANSTLVPVNSELVGSNGKSYKVTVGGTYANNAEIPVQSISTGAATNLEIGEILNWMTTPAYAQSTSVVTQAITGAVDAENDDTARNRLLSRLQNPPALGNWQQVADMCESFDPVVQKAFIYPAANGPSTLHIALAGYATDVSKSREIATTKMTALISSINGQLPEYVDTYISTVNDVPCDVAFKITIPYPVGSMNLGTGGGWVDSQPFPTADGMTKIAVSSVVSSTVIEFEVYGENPIPVPGVTHVSWIDKTDYVVKTATILSYVWNSGDSKYVVTLDTPFVGIATGDFIFPAMENAQTYVDAVIAQFAMMGPGEKSAVSSLLPRAYRKPRPNLSYPSTIDGVMLRAVIEASDEVLAVDYWYRQYSNNPPTIPASIETAPDIYVPNNIGFYPSSIV